ncbi:hypothetical protein GGI21_006840, partial [Coemansia aciculifera]
SPQQQAATPSSPPLPPPVAQSWYYQQPVLLLLNKEYATNAELQTTTLRSLGFTGGSVMVRFSYRAAKEPTSLEAVSPMQKSPQQQPKEEKEANGETEPAAAQHQPTSPKVAVVEPPAAAEPTTTPSTPLTNALGIVDIPAVATLPAEAKTGLALVLSTRQVRVLGAPSATAPALASRIVLPDSFYEAGSDDLRILATAQRARVAESEKGFSSREKQEEEERRRHAEFKTKHSRSLIRFRFPDQVQIQAAFHAHRETVAELYAFLDQILADPRVLESL